MKIYCDGSGWNGRESRVAAIRADGKHHILTSFNVERTNNEMEYLAVLNGLVLAEPGDEVLTDSQLVVHQLSGKYKIKAIGLRPFYEAASRLASLKEIVVKWIPREQNQADRLFRSKKKEDAES